MTGPVTWTSLRDEGLRRIRAGEWEVGQPIPTEAELAREFDCARATVNRALQALAETGLLIRRRRAGSIVAAQPVARATLRIPLIRREIEDRGARPGYRLLHAAPEVPPTPVQAALGLAQNVAHLRVLALHLSDDRPFVLESRWINLATVPEAANAPLDRISANEWLLNHIPHTEGRITLEAQAASAEEAATLDCPSGSALFVVERQTRIAAGSVTLVRLLYAPGHRLTMEI